MPSHAISRRLVELSYSTTRPAKHFLVTSLVSMGVYAGNINCLKFCIVGQRFPHRCRHIIRLLMNVKYIHQCDHQLMGLTIVVQDIHLATANLIATFCVLTV